MSLELLIRNALSLGELSPGAEREIARLSWGRSLSDRETKLLALLEDAIASGTIQRLALEFQDAWIRPNAACA
ncbi:hypothetical protein [Sphaerothrix gracilis]|uniref:hypothetical protein n=1 Tax=Sphaerothrix gracilis TaxID=3151835 RepID=UPI0031FD344D